MIAQYSLEPIHIECSNRVANDIMLFCENTKKHYANLVVKPESVSYIIGKNGCHIKDITTKNRNGSYVEYKADGTRFVVSSYSKGCVSSIISRIRQLERDHETNRKKYGEYRFVRRMVDHGLVTDIIKRMKEFQHSSFVEYKGDGLFVVSNYSSDELDKMVACIKEYDTIDFHNNDTRCQWIHRRDFQKVYDEINRLIENRVYKTPSSSVPRLLKTTIDTTDSFVELVEGVDDTGDMFMDTLVDCIDSYIEPSEAIEEICLDKEDQQYVYEMEHKFHSEYDRSKNPWLIVY